MFTIFVITCRGYGYLLRKIDIWKCATKLDLQEHVPAIYLLLSFKNSRACVDISVASLNSERLKNLIEYAKETSWNVPTFFSINIIWDAVNI